MASDELFRSVNPATEIVEREFSPHSAAEISDRLSQATLAFREWRTRSVPERGELLRALAGQMRLSQDAHARLMTVEMGKPWQQSLAEIEKCARTCEFYAEHGPRMLAPQTVEGNAALSSQVRFEPLGVVLAVMPWNFPYWQVVRFAAPALLAGNAGVLKHATNVLGCAEALEQLFHDAGFPPGVFTSLRVGRDHVSRLIQDDRIQAVTLTGSEAAGREVAAAAGQAIKKSVLELGGSDPFIVLADADLERTLDRAVEARTINNGQSCIAAKRFIVHRDVYAAFVEGLSARMLTLPVGDPLEPATKIGPLARQDLRETLHQQVRASLKEGAQLCTGGRPVDRRGWFYQPTVLSDVTAEMTAFREETFGPVAAVTQARDADEAIRLANHSSFGLGASLWTRDLELASALASDIEAGCVFINDFTKSDPSVPFGGVKRSGYGRELGDFGLHEFVNIKTVWTGN